MRDGAKAFGSAAVLLVLAALPVRAQTEPAKADPVITATQEAAGYARSMLTRSAEQMSEEDYAFRPTPEVRTFGQLLAHVAGSNYFFCAAAQGEKAPVADVEKTAKTRAEILKALSESFAYCDALYAGLNDANARTLVSMGEGPQRTRLVVLMFRNLHAVEHYGNVITYMRLRGKVPPSSQPQPKA